MRTYLINCTSFDEEEAQERNIILYAEIWWIDEPKTLFGSAMFKVARTKKINEMVQPLGSFLTSSLTFSIYILLDMMLHKIVRAMYKIKTEISIV